MKSRITALWLAGGIALLGCGILAVAQPAGGEQEREVKESEVPRPALVALKKVAAGTPITQFSEEIEHGITYYEGSWQGPRGHIDALVTASGDLVETEEAMPVDYLPRQVAEAARKMAGVDSKLRAEKKTSIHYEIKFVKDGKRREVLFAPDGRVMEQEAEADSEKDSD